MTALLEEEERCPGGFREDIQECKEQMLGAEVRMPKKLLRKEAVDEHSSESVLRGSPTVHEEKGDIMNCPIRESEIAEAIEKLSWIKAPGPDEIGSEFDKLFSNAFFPTLVRVFENIRERKPFPPSMRESHTVLIVADVTESRPISLAEVEAALRRVEVLCAASGTEINHINSVVYVCNAVSYPAALYRAQAVCFPGATAKRIHRGWAVLVWRSTLERTRRDNLFLHLESGGLGLVNVVLKLHVQRFILFRDTKDLAFLAALHHLGFPYLGKWMVNTNGRENKVAALRFYSEMVPSFEFFRAHLTWEYLTTVDRKSLYWDVTFVAFPPPLYRLPPVPDRAPRLFKLVRRLPVPLSSRDFFMRMHLDGLAVMARLHRKDIFAP
ncbi:hypothetical protein ISCGN_033190, partial [Ixodes scapularis]